jgi:hypothetical protein
MRVVSILTLFVLASASREVVNFDFAWRHHLGHDSGPSPAPPSPRQANCTAGEVGVNWGTGGRSHSNVHDVGKCCALCAADPSCGCWDLNTKEGECWTKSECANKVSEKDRTSALLPGANPTPGPAPTPGGTPPSQALPGFDDSKWLLVDAPHDMLIHQAYDPNGSGKMAFIHRNVGWYRKHFKLPAEWKGSSIWIYFEGVFHETTSYVNGKQINYHKQGYTAFALRLDDVPGIKYGDEENVLAMFVDASTGTGWWYEGGGLSRHNHLIRANPVHIEQDGAWVYTNSTSVGGADFHASVQVVSDASIDTGSVSIKTTVRDTSGAVVATGTTKDTSDLTKPIVATASASSGINYWTVKSPHL